MNNLDIVSKQQKHSFLYNTFSKKTKLTAGQHIYLFLLKKQLLENTNT